MKFFKTLREDGVAVNSAGAGAIAGIGVGVAGEPGIVPGRNKKSNTPKLFRRKSPIVTEDKTVGSIHLNIPVLIRMLEITREKIKSDDELHVFVENLMDIKNSSSSEECLTMKDVLKLFDQYSGD